jgi:hypothetical protein
MPFIEDILTDPFSAVGGSVPYGLKFTGPGVIDSPASLLKLVKQDHGLSENKKNHLSMVLNSPEAFDHIMAGVAGMMIARAAGSYAEMSKPARTLLSLAGFGIGNIIYNTLQERKFTSYDPKTGISRIK